VLSNLCCIPIYGSNSLTVLSNTDKSFNGHFPTVLDTNLYPCFENSFLNIVIISSIQRVYATKIYLYPLLFGFLKALRWAYATSLTSTNEKDNFAIAGILSLKSLSINSVEVKDPFVNAGP